VNNSTIDSQQYSIKKIIIIWALASFPMAILAWIITPLIGPIIYNQIGYTLFLTMTIGLIWQFVLVLLIVKKEEGSLKWIVLKNRLWLNQPVDPRTGKINKKLWFWLIPLLLLFALENSPLSPGSILNNGWIKLFPFLQQPETYNIDAFINSPESKEQLVGAWWFFGLFLVLAVFNTVLGEELLFRGILLPRMGIFGKWDWAANGILFGCYHLNQPWMIPSGILSGMFLFALPTRHFRSAWFGIITHSGQSIFLLILFLGIILGLA